MIKILFVCHGNICRSPMAEFLMKDMVEKQKLSDQFRIASAATSIEEIGNGIHYGTRRILDSLGISYEGKTALQLRRSDYRVYDHLIGMERENVKDIMRIVGGDSQHKIRRLLDFTDNPRDIADPWYTGDFNGVYRDIKGGCEALLAYLTR